MDPTDVSIEILKGIRDEGRKTNEHLDRTPQQLVQLGEELSHRIAESELRTATANTDLAGAVRDPVTTLRTKNALRPRLERSEQEIALLDGRTPDA